MGYEASHRQRQEWRRVRVSCGEIMSVASSGVHPPRQFPVCRRMEVSRIAAGAAVAGSGLTLSGGRRGSGRLDGPGDVLTRVDRELFVGDVTDPSEEVTAEVGHADTDCGDLKG